MNGRLAILSLHGMGHEITSSIANRRQTRAYAVKRYGSYTMRSEISGLEPRYLEIELTETVLMQHSEATASMLRALKAMGIRLALDDFGTGYSSLSYLRRFPIDALKIDRSFVQEIAGDSSDAPIIKAVIGMGKSIKLRVTAEGVETSDQFAFLQERHCDEGQGYYFSPPVVAEQFAELLKSGMGRNGRPLAPASSS